MIAAGAKARVSRFMRPRPGTSSIVGRPNPPGLERAQEVEDVLPLPSLQAIEAVDDLICLAVLALVGLDRLHQIVGPSVMKEKDALPDAPERSCPELIGACAALRDAVRKTFTHVVDEKVREEIRSLVG